MVEGSLLELDGDCFAEEQLRTGGRRLPAVVAAGVRHRRGVEEAQEGSQGRSETWRHGLRSVQVRQIKRWCSSSSPSSRSATTAFLKPRSIPPNYHWASRWEVEELDTDGEGERWICKVPKDFERAREGCGSAPRRTAAKDKTRKWERRKDGGRLTRFFFCLTGQAGARQVHRAFCLTGDMTTR